MRNDISSVVPRGPSESVKAQPLFWLRLEGLTVFVVFIVLYVAGRHSWWVFAILFLSPNLSFIGYLAGLRVGALCYNLVHNYALPVAIGAVLHSFSESLAVPLIWIAHIGADRALGFGLKYDAGFAFTHLGGPPHPPQDSRLME